MVCKHGQDSRGKCQKPPCKRGARTKAGTCPKRTCSWGRKAGKCRSRAQYDRDLLRLQMSRARKTLKKYVSRQRSRVAYVPYP